ncbi:UNVERIFIED_CONTAM: hypothetical protein FKN15_012112 [Acipenser sinensis]
MCQSSDVSITLAQLPPAEAAGSSRGRSRERSSGERCSTEHHSSHSSGARARGSIPLPRELIPLMRRANDALRVPWPSATVERCSVYDERKELPSEAPPIHPDFWQELTSSWQHPATAPAVPRSGTTYRVHEGDKMGLVQFPPVGSTIPALAQPANLALLSKDAACPNKQCRVTEVLLKKAYSANAFVARLGNYNTCLVAYQSHIWGSAAEGGLALDQTEELRLISRMLLRLAQLLSQATGRSMAALVAARRQLWLSQARLTENNKAALLDAPITPGHTFGPAVDDLLLRSKAAREATKAFSDLAPKLAPPPKKQWYQRPPPRPQWQPQGGPRGSPAVTDRSSRGRGRQRRFQRNAPDKRPQAPKPKQQP